MVGGEGGEEAGDDHDDRHRRLAGRQQHQRGDHDGDTGGERDHRRHRADRAEEDGVRHAGEEVDDAQHHALAEPDQHQPVHRAVDRGHHLPPDLLAARPEDAVRGGEALTAHRLALAEQEEQRQQREAEQHDAVERLLADVAAELAIGSGVDLLRPLLGEAGVRQVLRPPLADRLRDFGRQLADGIGHRDAVLLCLLAVVEHGMGFARRLDAEPDQRDQEDEQHQQREDRRQHLLAELGGNARRGALEQRPQRDRQHQRPDQRAEIVLQDEEADAEQDEGEHQPSSEMPLPPGPVVGRPHRTGVRRRLGLPGRRGAPAVALAPRSEPLGQLAHRCPRGGREEPADHVLSAPSELRNFAAKR